MQSPVGLQQLTQRQRTNNRAHGFSKIELT